MVAQIDKANLNLAPPEHIALRRGDSPERVPFPAEAGDARDLLQTRISSSIQRNEARTYSSELIPDDTGPELGVTMNLPISTGACGDCPHGSPDASELSLSTCGGTSMLSCHGRVGRAASASPAWRV